LIIVLRLKFFNKNFRVTMEVTNYLPFRCVIFMNESTLIVGVCVNTKYFVSNSLNYLFKGT